MVHSNLRMMAVAVCLAGVSCFKSPAAGAEANGPGALDGLWSGSWGLQIDPDGVVHQPVKAELFIQGDHVECGGFPEPSEFTGTARIDAGAKQIRIAPAAKAGGRPADAIVFAYEVNGDKLTLTDRNKRSIYFSKVLVNPLSEVKVEFLAAIGMNSAGDLLVTDFSVHRAGRSAEIAPALARRRLRTKQADVFLVQESGLKKVKVDESRQLLHDPTTVLVAYRPDDRPSPLFSSRLWQERDSEAVGRTVYRVLRPGTLVFVVPESARVAPEP
jgi:hypothetical protein